MAVTAELKSLVDAMPEADSRGMMTENLDKEKIERAISGLHAGGRQHALGLIELLGEPGSAEDVKPHYALHCLANHAVVCGDEEARRELSETLASRLSGDLSPVNKAFLCQCLQWMGRGEAAAPLGRLLLDEELVEPAAMALAAIREGAAEQFRSALAEAQGKCRLNIVQGLGAVEDKASAAALREALTDSDREIRIAAGWALARIGDAGSVDALIQAAGAEPGWERIQAAKHCLALAEKLAAAGRRDEAAKICVYLRDSRSDPAEAYVRDAAQRLLDAA